MSMRMPPSLPFWLVKCKVDGSSAQRTLERGASITTRPFTNTATSLHKSKNYKPRKHVDVWVLRHREEKHKAFGARLKERQQQKAMAAGDRIRGLPAPTPFVASFDTGTEVGHRMMKSVADGSPGSGGRVGQSLSRDSEGQERALVGNTAPSTTGTISREAESPKPRYLNHFLDLNELNYSLAASKELTAPHISPDRAIADPNAEHQVEVEHQRKHEIRSEALKRIFAPENSNARERLLLNKRRCIDRFGRHNTDNIFPLPEPAPSQPQLRRKERVGPDTGSSEVQIAILTAKIRTLADKFESREGRYDWVNKRNLRLLLHRRQKLLKYFEKKDRGGQRWHHLLETLGLTEATWKGEIEVP